MMIRSRLAALLLSAVIAAAPAEPVVQHTLTLETLPGEIQPYGDHTADEEKWLRLVACHFFDGVQEPKDVTDGFENKAVFGIPEKAKRGYVFELRPSEGAEITPDDLAYSLDAYLGSEGCPDRLNRLHHTLPGTVETLAETGFSSAEEAIEAGFTELFVDVYGFWGLNAGWRSIHDRTRLRDWAIPAGLDEMYVTPGYLYRQYLQTGSRYEKMQRDFVGVALSQTVRSGILTEDDRVLLVFSVPTAASVVAADLAGARLLRADGSFVGAYEIAERTEQTVLLQKNERWWGDSPCDAPSILCRTTGAETTD